MFATGASDTNNVRMVGADSVHVVVPAVNGVVRIRTGTDTLQFDLRPLARNYANATPHRQPVPAERLRIEARAGHRRGLLALNRLNGMRTADSLRIDHWSGWMLLGADSLRR